MPVASSEDQVLILGAFVDAIRYNLTAAGSLLAEGKDRQGESVDIWIPRASIEAIRCNLTAASSRLVDGEPFVPKDRQRGPTEETVLAEGLDGQEDAEEDEPRKGKYGGEGSREGRSRGEPRDIASRSRSRDRRGQSKGAFVFLEANRYNLTAASSLLAEGVPLIPKDWQRKPGDILVPRASIEAIRCNLTAASSRLADGEPLVPKDRQRGPTDGNRGCRGPGWSRGGGARGASQRQVRGQGQSQGLE